MVSVFIDKKTTFFDQFLLQPLFVSPRIARVLVDKLRLSTKTEITVNDIGKIILEEWNQTRELRPNVVLDAFVIMPNHIHAIIVLVNPDESTNVGARRVSPLPHNNFNNHEPHQKPESLLPNGATKGSLGAIVGSIKASVSKRVNQARGVQGLTVWQRGFHDRIIRNEAELERTRTYIEHNPGNWATDEENR